MRGGRGWHLGLLLYDLDFLMLLHDARRGDLHVKDAPGAHPRRHRHHQQPAPPGLPAAASLSLPATCFRGRDGGREGGREGGRGRGAAPGC